MPRLVLLITAHSRALLQTYNPVHSLVSLPTSENMLFLLLSACIGATLIDAGSVGTIKLRPEQVARLADLLGKSK